MENITKALMMAFSMMMFVIGFSYSMYLINHLLATSEVLLDTVSTTNYYDNIEVTSGANTREVSVDAIISTLYRYYKENYTVKIYDASTLLQVFDVNLEGKIAKAAADTKGVDEELVSLKNSIYNKNNNSAYLFEAPWTGSTDENTRARIDFFLHGTKGYINETLVDYSRGSPAFSNDGGFLGKYPRDTVFIESVVEYAYVGDTISTPNGLETITGNTQESSKIIITYTKK